MSQTETIQITDEIVMKTARYLHDLQTIPSSMNETKLQASELAKGLLLFLEAKNYWMALKSLVPTITSIEISVSPFEIALFEAEDSLQRKLTYNKAEITVVNTNSAHSPFADITESRLSDHVGKGIHFSIRTGKTFFIRWNDAVIGVNANAKQLIINNMWQVGIEDYEYAKKLAQDMANEFGFSVVEK